MLVVDVTWNKFPPYAYIQLLPNVLIIQNRPRAFIING